MEPAAPNMAQIRGKDLVGGVKVMPMGLDAAIKKRTSGEFTSEQRGGNLSFSTAKQSSNAIQESRQMGSFKEEVGSSGGFQESSSLMTSSKNQASFMQSSSQSMSNQMSSSTNQSLSSSKTMSSSKKITSSDMSSSSMMSQKTNMASSKSFASSESKSISSITAQKDFHSQEIGQDELKTQLVSAITDLETDRDFVNFDKENQPINLTSPPQTFSPTPTPSYASQPKQASLDMFSPPPLEPMELPSSQEPIPHNQIQGPAMLPQTQEPASLPQIQDPVTMAPTRNETHNGFSEFSSSSTKTTTEVQQMSQITESSMQLAQVMNGGLHHEETSSVQGSSSSSSLLQKIMTPAAVEYDTGSLKRRDPRKMFTDSSFYNAKHHPTVADQVEMAHKLSSAMFSKENKMAKGQQMFLSRAQTAGEDVVDDGPHHDKVPNLKLVMNPEGKVHEWGDLPADQLPDMAQLAAHAAAGAPDLNSPDPVAEDLISGVGKGETVVPRHPINTIVAPPASIINDTFVSAYRKVFDQNRGVFGTTEDPIKTPESPKVLAKVSQPTSPTQIVGTSFMKYQASPKTFRKVSLSPNLNQVRQSLKSSNLNVTIADSKPTTNKNIVTTEHTPPSPIAPPKVSLSPNLNPLRQSVKKSNSNVTIVDSTPATNKNIVTTEHPSSSPITAPKVLLSPNLNQLRQNVKNNNQNVTTGDSKPATNKNIVPTEHPPPPSPIAPPRKVFINTRKNEDTITKSPIINRNRNSNGNKATNKLNSIVRRHRSFNEGTKEDTLDNRRQKTDRPVMVLDNCKTNFWKPSDTLKTPYLLPSSDSKSNSNLNNVQTTNKNVFKNFSSTSNLNSPPANVFPQINSTSMVAKTKALFENKENYNTDNNTSFIPLGKSRTFSSFPTSDEGKENTALDSPCIPNRNSSRKVLATYKSMNANINHCGSKESSSTSIQDRIPMRNFFS